MSNQIQYSEGEIGDFKIIPDFLPTPSEMAMKNESTKVTISLSSESVAFF